jgi:DNA-binding transcriptional MerR regulator
VRGYTVSEVAKLSGVSVRTLHHYDEVGLLKPACVGANGYRYYSQDELLRLQQILFHRELGFPLEEIGKVLDAPDFDRAAALKRHREQLLAESRRYRRLVRTIDETLAALEGETRMDEKKIYEGFDIDPEKQAKAEEWLRGRYGPEIQAKIDHSKATMKGWSKAEVHAFQDEIRAFDAAIAKAMADGLPADSRAVQSLMRGHCAWIGRGWGVTPDRGAYLGLAGIYQEEPGFRARYEGLAPGLTEYLAEAMKVFADRELA